MKQEMKRRNKRDQKTQCAVHWSVSPHTLVPSIYCIIRRDETNQILLVHGGYSVPDAVPSVILWVQVAVLRRCSHALCQSHLKSMQEVLEGMMMHFSILLGFLFACFSHTCCLSLSHTQTQKHIDCLRGSEAINM